MAIALDHSWPHQAGSMQTSEVSVSAYPEKHPEKPRLRCRHRFPEGKSDAAQARHHPGVLSTTIYISLPRRVRARGIAIPIVPGIMPMHNFKQARNFVTRAGTTCRLAC